jgi:hypothetical protein
MPVLAQEFSDNREVGSSYRFAAHVGDGEYVFICPWNMLNPYEFLVFSLELRWIGNQNQNI